MAKRILVILLAIAGAGLLLASLRLPLWQMHLEAPQYKGEDALEVKVFADAMRGDIGELKVLNSYIGVHVPETLPQNRWLPWVIMGGGIAGVICAFLPGVWRRRALFTVPALITIFLVVAAVQAQMQMHDISTNRDEKATLVGVEDFTTPLLGRTKVAQFTITSFLSWGSLTIAGGLACFLIGAWLSRTPRKHFPPQEPPSGVVGGLNPYPRSV